MSEPAPSSAPVGWWEYIGLGDGAGPKAIVAGGESAARTVRKETSRPARTTSSQNLERRPLSRRASNRVPKEGFHHMGPCSIRGAGLGQRTNAGQEDRDGVA